MTAPVIALLDNDPAFLATMHDLLTSGGYRTLRCRPDDVRDAHALVKHAQPALVILDRWWWRGNDGWEFLLTLWADPQTTHIGVVLTAGQAVAPSLQAEILRAMRCQVVRTPLDQHEVLRAVAAVLGPSLVTRAPDRRVAAMPAAAPVLAARALDQGTDHPDAAERVTGGSQGHAVDERAAVRRSYALDVASDS